MDMARWSHPMENLLILDRITGLLETKELFKCRLVNQKWNSCCVRHLKAKNSYQIKLTESILPEYIDFVKKRGNEMEWCNRYRVSLDLRYTASWLIGSLSETSLILQVFGLQPLKTLWNNVRNQEGLKSLCNSAEKIVLGECLDLSLLKQENLLQNITDLEISVDSSTLPYSEILGFEFLSLQGLKVIVHDHLTKLDWQCLKEFVRKNCPKIQTMRLNLVDDGKLFWACICESCEEFDDFRSAFPDVNIGFEN